MVFLLLKTLHIFGFVAWFAALFYIVRLFVYHTEAQSRPELERKVLSEQYTLMERRLMGIIGTPAMVGTWCFGLGMAVQNGIYLQPWFHLKLLLLLALSAYHGYCLRLMRGLWAGRFVYSSQALRWFNEIATLLLFSIAMVAVFKRLVFGWWALVPLIILALFLAAGIRLYARLRQD